MSESKQKPLKSGKKSVEQDIALKSQAATHQAVNEINNPPKEVEVKALPVSVV